MEKNVRSLYFALSLLFFLVLNFSYPLYGKVRFLTFQYNKPELIKIQYLMLKKFIKDDFELIVFNDANDPVFSEEIQNICKINGIKCVNYPQDLHLTHRLNDQIAEWLKDPSINNIHAFISPEPSDIGKQPSVRHCHVIDYALRKFGYNHDDIVVLIDGDAFPIRKMSVRSLLKKHQIVGIQKSCANINYLWVVFTAFKPKALPNLKDFKFDIALVKGIIHDTGSSTYFYLKNNRKIKFLKIPGVTGSTLIGNSEEKLLEEGYTAAEVRLIKKNDLPPVEFHLGKKLFHFSTSSFNLDGHIKKEENFKEFCDEILRNPNYPMKNKKIN